MSSNGEKIDIYSGEPKEVLGLLKIEGESYALVRWTNGPAYVPYTFMRENFGRLLVDFYAKNSRFKTVRDK